MRRGYAFAQHRAALASVAARPALLSVDEAAALQTFVSELASGPLAPLLLAIAAQPAQQAIDQAASDRDVAQEYATITVAALRYVESLEALVLAFKGAAAFLETAIAGRSDAAALRAAALQQFHDDALRMLGVPLLVDQPREGENHG